MATRNVAEFRLSWPIGRPRWGSIDAAVAMASPLIAFLVFTAILATKAGAHSSGHVKYSYTGDTGPSRWASLDPKYSLCAKGKSQSPIDIPKSKAVQNKDLKPLIREYYPSNVTLADNLVNIGLQFGEHCGQLISDGKPYELKQMHWHTPSEHSIDGVHYDAELHLVHLADNGTYAVIGILYRLGKADPVVGMIEKELPKLAKHTHDYGYHDEIPVRKINMKQLQKRTRKYYRYYGSFTTPPCSETVTWYILSKVKSISKKQIEALKFPLDPECKNNARPLQPLNGRQIELYKEVIPPNKIHQGKSL